MYLYKQRNLLDNTLINSASYHEATFLDAIPDISIFSRIFFRENWYLCRISKV